MIKHKAILYAHAGMQQWGVNYWETYSSVVNRIIVSSPFAIESIHGFPSIPIDFVLDFPQANLDVYVFMDLPLVVEVDRKRIERVLKLNK